MTLSPSGSDAAPAGSVRAAAPPAALPAGFLSRYRRRSWLPYLPPPSWVGSAPPRRVTPHAVLFTVDELGKSNYLPVVCDADYDAARLDQVVAPLLEPAEPTPCELRLIGEQPAAREALHRRGFVVDRVQRGMSLELGAPTGDGGGSAIGAGADDDELARHQNICFGLRLTADDVARMRRHADWSDANLFVRRDDDGTLVATLRLVTDEHPDGERYGLLRGLAVHPERRRASIPLLTALYQAALRRAAEVGVARCHLLVDHDHPSTAAMFEYIGFRRDVLMYRMRQRTTAPG